MTLNRQHSNTPPPIGEGGVTLRNHGKGKRIWAFLLPAPNVAAVGGNIPRSTTAISSFASCLVPHLLCPQRLLLGHEVPENGIHIAGRPVRELFPDPELGHEVLDSEERLRQDEYKAHRRKAAKTVFWLHYIRSSAIVGWQTKHGSKQRLSKTNNRWLSKQWLYHLDGLLGLPHGHKSSPVSGQAVPPSYPSGRPSLVQQLPEVDRRSPVLDDHQSLLQERLFRSYRPFNRVISKCRG